jgi:hypothetical protein
VGVAISGLTAATDFPEAAEFEIEDAGVSKRLSKAQLRQLLFDDPAFSFESPQQGDVLVYDGSDWVPGGWGRLASHSPGRIRRVVSRFVIYNHVCRWCSVWWCGPPRD